jgi:hypothetical protein
VISSLTKRLKVSILPNVHFLWCTAKRSPKSFSHHFSACKIFTLRFHCCESHILQRPPLVPRLADKPTLSPKSTHISHVICVVNMVKRSTNRSLGSLAGTSQSQIVHSKYSCTKSLHFAQRTLPLVHVQEITKKFFTLFSSLQNIHTKVSPLQKSHPTEALSCAKARR